MILEREQINRYLRQIIMPEISGPGQKKLLESSVFIYGENVRDTALAVYYLAAAGVGFIYCHFEDEEGLDELCSNVRDLNGDISIEQVEYRYSDFRILFGSPEFIIKKGRLVYNGCNGFVPVVVSLYNGWKGGMKVFRDTESLDSFLSNLADKYIKSCVGSNTEIINSSILSACLSGALCTMEVIKLALGIGEAAEDFLYFNLLKLEFLRTGKDEPDYAINELCKLEQKINPEIKLQNRKVLIAGTGGLGSPAAYALALSGIGTIGLIDYDVVEISNLNRQILHSTSRIGQFKADSAAEFLKRIRADININIYNTSIQKENVFDIIKDYDVVIDAVDNFPTRFLLNDACYFAGKPMIDAGVLRFDGTCTAFIPQNGPCYRCLLSDIPAQGSVPSCSEAGVLGPVPGIMGFIQAAEAVKLLNGYGNLSNGKIIIFDGLYSEFRTVELRKKSNCPLCGENATIHELQNYVFVCRE